MSVLSAVLVVMVLTGVSAASEVKWLPLKEGARKARAEKKPLIVDFFFGAGCPRCEVIEKTVYSNPSIGRKIMDEFVPVKIDLTKKLSPEEEALGKRHDYRNDCLLLILDYTGEVIKDPSGATYCFAENIPPEWFVSYLDMARAVNRQR